MIPKALLFLAFLLFNLLVTAQNDSVMYNVGNRLPDGVYVSYEDFRRNAAIVKEQIISKEDKEQLEFVGKVLATATFSYNQNDILHTLESKRCWGYVQNNTFYINYKGDFYRVPVLGSISYLVASVTVVNNGFYDPRFGYMGATTTKEIREFVFNFYDGVLMECTTDRVDELLSRDKTLFEEYKKIPRRKQKEQMYHFIRKYNELHPVYFLK